LPVLTRAEPRHTGVDAIEIDEALQCRLQRAGVVDARGGKRSTRLLPWRQWPRGKKSACAKHRRKARIHLIEKIAGVIAIHQIGERRVQRHLRPKFAKPVNTGIGGIARDNCSVNRSNRNSGNPIGMDVGFGQGLVDASLVGPQSTAALQEQRYAIERRTPVGGREVWSRLKVHGSVLLVYDCPSLFSVSDGS
jgi:hypothetical protein